MNAQAEVFRPWGSFEVMFKGAGYQVKRLKLKPGNRVSLQRHRYRTEHWVVVRGVAEVTCQSDIFRLAESESACIPQGAIHRLHNPGETPLEVVETQIGSYLGEDDIERFADDYGRTPAVGPDRT